MLQRRRLAANILICVMLAAFGWGAIFLLRALPLSLVGPDWLYWLVRGIGEIAESLAIKTHGEPEIMESALFFLITSILLGFIAGVCLESSNWPYLWVGTAIFIFVAPSLLTILNYWAFSTECPFRFGPDGPQAPECFTRWGNFIAVGIEAVFAPLVSVLAAYWGRVLFPAEK